MHGEILPGVRCARPHRRELQEATVQEPWSQPVRILVRTATRTRTDARAGTRSRSANLHAGPGAGNSKFCSTNLHAGHGTRSSEFGNSYAAAAGVPDALSDEWRRSSATCRSSTCRAADNRRSKRQQHSSAKQRKQGHLQRTATAPGERRNAGRTHTVTRPRQPRAEHHPPIRLRWRHARKDAVGHRL